MIKKKRFFLFVYVLSVLFLCACNVQIFEEEVDTSGVEQLNKDNLHDDYFYVKDGATFAKLVEVYHKENLVWLFDEDEKIPTLYKNEVLAYFNTKPFADKSVKLKRYQVLGYTFGMYKGLINQDGLYEFNTARSCEKSSAYHNFPSEANIKIESINDIPVCDFSFYNGLLLGFNGFEKYEISYYEGTYYKTIELSCNAKTLEAFEEYELDNINKTKNGYVQIEMLSDMKTGYYYIDGFGMFRYIDAPKSEALAITDIDYNKPFYEDTKPYADKKDNKEEKETISAMKTYNVTVNEDTKNMAFTVSYEENDIEPSMVLIAPNNTKYTFEKTSEGKKEVLLSLAQKGKWTVLIKDEGVTILNVSATKKESEKVNKEITETRTLSFEIAKAKVVVEYEGFINTAYVITPFDEIVSLTPTKDGRYEAILDYAKAGDYKIVVNYEEHTKILLIDIEDVSKYTEETWILE